MKKHIIAILSIVLSIAIIVSGMTYVCLKINSANIRAQAQLDAQKDALSAAVEIVKYRYSADYMAGNMGDSASDYASAVNILYTRLISTYINAYKQK
jgi:flagellar basal body-associated protein FliL